MLLQKDKKYFYVTGGHLDFPFVMHFFRTLATAAVLSRFSFVFLIKFIIS